MDFQTLDDITRKLAAAVPEELKSARAELEVRFRGILEDQFARMGLVTREEFEIARQVLERSRQKLEALEAKQADTDSG